MPARPLAWCTAVLLALMAGCAPVVMPVVDRAKVRAVLEAEP